MKIGAEKRKQVVIMCILVVIAAVLLLRDVVHFGGGTGAAAGGSATATTPLPTLDPRLHLSELERVRSIHYSGSLRNLFEVAPERAGGGPHDAGLGPSAVKLPPAQPAPPPLPVGPPPIPLKFYGFATRQGDAKRVFLQLGDNVYVVTEGQMIEHRYVIGRIDQSSVEVRDIQTQQSQTLPLISG